MINTLTPCQGIRDVFDQRASSSTDDQRTHNLSSNQRRVRSASLELHRGSTHSRPVKGLTMCSVSEPRAPEDQHTHMLSRDQRRVRSASLELHRGSTHSQSVKGSATCLVSEPRAPQRINTLTHCQGINDVFGQRASSSTEDQHTHNLSSNQRRVRSASLELHRGSTHLQAVKGSATCSVSEPRAPEDQHTHPLSRDQQCLRSAC
jgi:hypothetical protein